MLKRHIRIIISVIVCAVLAAAFIVALYFSAPKIYAVPETEGELNYTLYHLTDEGEGVTEAVTAEIGKDVTAVRISDLKDLGKITKVNYVADEFLTTNSLSKDIEIVDLSKPFEFAKKGTLIFIILNLDPYSEDFDEQSNRLDEYKIGDNWRFTVSLPKIFCASNVYSKTTLIDRHGDIENYDFSSHNTNYDIQTEKFKSETSSTYINVSFYTRRTALANSLNSATLITVHYQSESGAYSGIKNMPLIGTESSVKNFEQSSHSLLLAVAILSVVVLAVLIVLSVIEKSKKFVAAVVWIFGISALLLSRYFLNVVTAVPLFWTAISLAASFIILGGAQLAICTNLGKAPTKAIFTVLSLIGALFAFIIPFIPYSPASAMRTVCLVIKAIGAVALTAFIALALFKKRENHNSLNMSCATVIAVAIIASLFMPQVFPSHFNPIFWLCAATTLATFLGVVSIIMDIKKSNIYLTNNLHKEVERQIKDVKAVIADRDNLLQFVSHDMKKPLSSAVTMCNTAIERETDEEQIKTINIIKQDAERVIENLSQIAVYAKLNYLEEPSQTVDISELCALLYKYHEFDCKANGVILKNTVNGSIKAFIKQKGLENVVSNIVINALEHANCSSITFSAKSNKDRIILSISDDGKGIEKDIDIFKPYISENSGETNGVGLYICKNIIESMNGELYYESSPNGTTFYISLLKA